MSEETHFNDEKYYSYEITDGELTVYSECCADTMSREVMEKLYSELKGIFDSE